MSQLINVNIKFYMFTKVSKTNFGVECSLCYNAAQSSKISLLRQLGEMGLNVLRLHSNSLNRQESTSGAG